MSKELSSIAVCLEVMGHYPGYITPEERKEIVDSWEKEAARAGMKNQYTIVKNPDWGWDTLKI